MNVPNPLPFPFLDDWFRVVVQSLIPPLRMAWIANPALDA